MDEDKIHNFINGLNPSTGNKIEIEIRRSPQKTLNQAIQLASFYDDQNYERKLKYHEINKQDKLTDDKNERDLDTIMFCCSFKRREDKYSHWRIDHMHKQIKIKLIISYLLSAEPLMFRPAFFIKLYIPKFFPFKAVKIVQKFSPLRYKGGKNSAKIFSVTL